MEVHVVVKGDTLWKIARQYGIPFEDLKRVNAHLANPDYIVPGMKIFLPARHEQQTKPSTSLPKTKGESVKPPQQKPTQPVKPTTPAPPIPLPTADEMPKPPVSTSPPSVPKPPSPTKPPSTARPPSMKPPASKPPTKPMPTPTPAPPPPLPTPMPTLEAESPTVQPPAMPPMAMPYPMPMPMPYPMPQYIQPIFTIPCGCMPIFDVDCHPHMHHMHHMQQPQMQAPPMQMPYMPEIKEEYQDESPICPGQAPGTFQPQYPTSGGWKMVESPLFESEEKESPMMQQWDESVHCPPEQGYVPQLVSPAQTYPYGGYPMSQQHHYQFGCSQGCDCGCGQQPMSISPMQQSPCWGMPSPCFGPWQPMPVAGPYYGYNSYGAY
ncbi:morphogenetic protein associated with SpoVID [Sporosarcina luteola]|nr:morphogenetic protein associated with SpoVID [Sporosarcina luteola]